MPAASIDNLRRVSVVVATSAKGVGLNVDDALLEHLDRGGLRQRKRLGQRLRIRGSHGRGGNVPAEEGCDDEEVAEELHFESWV